MLVIGFALLQLNGAGVGDGVGHFFAGELCRTVGFGATHHFPD